MASDKPLPTRPVDARDRLRGAKPIGAARANFTGRAIQSGNAFYKNRQKATHSMAAQRASEDWRPRCWGAPSRCPDLRRQENPVFLATLQGLWKHQLVYQLWRLPRCTGKRPRVIALVQMQI